MGNAASGRFLLILILYHFADYGIIIVLLYGPQTWTLLASVIVGIPVQNITV